MALKRSKLSQIPQRNKDLAFGYVHEKEKQNKVSVPEMIKYLCLVYFNPNKDEFDPDQCDEKIKIDGNSIITQTNPHNVQTVYLKNIVSSGVHLWKFKCIEDLDLDQIGVFNMDYKHLIKNNDDYYFDNHYNQRVYTCRGYGFASHGRLTDSQDPSEWGREYGYIIRQQL